MPDPIIIPASDPLPPDPVDPITAQALRMLGADMPVTPEIPDPIEPDPDPAPPAPVPDPAPPTPAPDPAPPTPAPPVPAPATVPDAGPRKPNRLDRLEGVVSKLADAVTQPAPAPQPTPAAPAPTISPVDQKVALRLEAVTRVAGPQAAERYKEFLTKDRDFRVSWEKANPGKRFDAGSDEYAEFRDAHEPDVPAEDIIREEAVIVAKRQLSEEFEQRLQSERVEQARDAAEREASRIVAEVPKLLVPQGEKADDKFVATAVRLHQSEAAQMLQAAHRLFTPNTNVGYNPEDPVQRGLVDTAVKYEREYAKMPAEDSTLPDGRRFVTAAQWDRLPAKDRRAHWTLFQEPRVMSELVAFEIQSKVKRDAESFRRDFGAPPTPAPSAPPVVPAPAPAPIPAIVPATPPSGGAGPGTVPSTSVQPAPSVDYFGR